MFEKVTQTQIVDTRYNKKSFFNIWNFFSLVKELELKAVQVQWLFQLWTLLTALSSSCLNASRRTMQIHRYWCRDMGTAKPFPSRSILCGYRHSNMYLDIFGLNTSAKHTNIKGHITLLAVKKLHKKCLAHLHVYVLCWSCILCQNPQKLFARQPTNRHYTVTLICIAPANRFQSFESIIRTLLKSWSRSVIKSW